MTGATITQRSGGCPASEHSLSLEAIPTGYSPAPTESERPALETNPVARLAPDRSTANLSGSVPDPSDASLVAAIRCDPPDTSALDELAQRHWRSLFARCQLMTLNREAASDLAQEAWCRVLRARHSLKPEGNFAAYLNAIAMNIWRDRCRGERRAGAMAEKRLASLDAELPDADGDVVVLSDAVADVATIESDALAMLKLDIDHALERLPPHLRGVLVARFLLGESCADIAHRHGRTEQTISAWVRQGVQEMKAYFEERRGNSAAKGTS
jgi:RNA polymerase sigma-70 factor (ECF subfamily)